MQTPFYTSASVVSAGSYSADALAPNTIASMFGTDLSYVTAATTGANMVGGGLPIHLGGVTVYISGIPAGLFYVSPSQINFLVPNDFLPGTQQISVVRDGVTGANVPIVLGAAGPALFQDSGGNAIATHLDSSVITAAAPAHAGEWIVLYADGLGDTVPLATDYMPATGAAPLAAMSSFSVLLDGVAAPPSAIYYAGLTPGCAGLYQVNLKLPDTTGPNPEIRLVAGTAESVPAIHLAVQ